MRPRIVAGNWKMNGDRDFAAALVGELARASLPGNVQAIVMPPFPYLAGLAREWAGKGILGGQDVASTKRCVYGRVSAAMLADVGATHVLVGHSERRQYHREDSALVARKFVAAKAAGLVPVLCVGETKDEREGGSTEAVIASQLAPVFEAGGDRALEGAVVAYEPVWAIGTGLTASPEQAQAVHAFIRGEAGRRDAPPARCRSCTGSCKPDNAPALFRSRTSMAD